MYRFIYLLVLSLTLPLAFSVERKHVLKATPQTVVIGYYDATTPPVLRVASGDVVEIQALGVASPAAYKKAGLDESEE